MSRILKSIVPLAAVLGIAACSVVGGEAAPEPDYTTVSKQEPFEIRDYGPLVTAQTPMDDGTNDAFGRLFDYISGENTGARKIAMTAPVLNSGASEGDKIAMTAPVLQGGDGDRTMAFILPAEFTAETAPLPTNPKVTLGTIAPRRVAVVRYAWSMEGNAAEAEARLREWMKSEGLTPTGPAEVAGYNPPWTLPMYRRNEVMIPIAAN